jgi:hypothetical protein
LEVARDWHFFWLFEYSINFVRNVQIFLGV